MVIIILPVGSEQIELFHAMILFWLDLKWGVWMTGVIVFRLLNITGNEICGVTGGVGWSVEKRQQLRLTVVLL